MKSLDVWDSIPTPPLFIEEVARSAGGVYITTIQELPPPLRGTPSINRGRARLLSAFEKNL